MKSKVQHLLYRIAAWAMVILAGAQLVLMLVSWLVTAAMPDNYMHSLLSAEGIRWFFGGFVDQLASHALVYLLLLSVACGALVRCGMLRYDKQEYRHRVAIRMVGIEFLLFVLVMMALTLVPHAILLNVMGGIVDSSLSKSLLACICFVVLVMSITFGMMSERFKGLEDVFEATCYGIRVAAPLFVIYVLLAQLYASFMYFFF